MKLKISLQKDKKHSDIVTCVGWASSDELYSVSDDHQILRWDFNSGETHQVVQLPQETYATDIHWVPSGGKKRELFVLACTDGRFLFISRLGRVEKSVEAHKGAVLGAQWSYDTTALLTYGEDGAAKIWSRAGMLRTIIAQSTGPMYAACWSPDSDAIAYTSGRSLVLKPLQPAVKPTQWKAHDGLILCLDWSSANSLLVSGGEDRKYKVWDSYGRGLYSSYLHDSPISSVKWAPDGDLFAVGSFNTLRLCDRTGWSHSLEKPASGTVFKLAWTQDGTQFSGACGNGQVIFAQVVDRHLEWDSLEACVNHDNTVDVRDVTTDAREHLEFSERIIKTSLGWGHLIVTTSTQAYIYNSRNWTTPVTLDMRGSVGLIQQSERHFLLTDSASGVQLVSYEGRVVSSIKSPGVQSSMLSQQTTSLSRDTVVIRDHRDDKRVHAFDALTGKELGEGKPLVHKTEVVGVALSQCGPPTERLLALLDKNNDLYITTVRGPLANTTQALGTMVSSVAWNNGSNILVGMCDTKFIAWYHPGVVYTDKELLPQTLLIKQGSEFSKSPQVVGFVGNQCTLRRSDGALIRTSLSPLPGLLHQHTSARRWEAATKLCRFVKDPALWACLAAMATDARDLGTAQTAYAAINEVDKVQFLSRIKELSSREQRNTELALFCHQPTQAEAAYLTAGLVYRAIDLNLSLFNWERALEIAVKHKTHVDTVLAFREVYLKEIGCSETLQHFQQYSGKLSIDWDKIRAKISLEEGATN
ncbi:intraflagellar transport protein 80 homolog [Halichondria panicea]|uniref:intraflagellar transport protein 80 homolog n=1 Tax=Halichondria panicea TaxID=6063 RepID=UPI00312BBD0E